MIAPFLLAPVFQAALLAAPTLPPAPPLVPVEELWTHPERHMGQAVRVHLSVDAHVETFEGWITRFHPARHLQVVGWSDAQLPWLEGDYDTPRARVFARRGSYAEAALRRADRHDRLVLEVVVREHLLNEPWIEVTGAVRTREHVPEGTLLHAIKAQELLGRGAFGMAADELERALAAPLPPHAHAVLAGARDACVEARTTLAGVRRGRDAALEAALERTGDALRGAPVAPR